MAYKCNICNKIYSSYKSLWNHNKKFHKNIITQNNLSITPIITHNNLSINKLKCKYCSKIFAYNQGCWRHQKICKERVDIKNITIHSNNGIINNGIINNITNIIKFGNENIFDILTEQEKNKIINCRLLAIEESIKQIHFNKDKPEFQNIKINNLRSNIALVHDGEKFNAMNQYSAISSLIDNHVESIEQILDDKKSVIPIRTAERLEMLISKLGDNYKKIIDEETNRTFKNYKDYKVDTVKHMIYNESNKTK
jgi:hypothetical protein